MPKQSISKGEITRLRIVEAAIVEFSLNGFYGGTLDNVAKRGGVKKPLLYHYFADKYALLGACIEVSVQKFATILAGMNLVRMSGRECLNAYFEANLELAKSSPEVVKLLLTLYANSSHQAGLKEIHRKIIADARGRYESALYAGVREKIWTQDIDVESSARLLHQWIVGAFTEYVHLTSDLLYQARLREDWKHLRKSLTGS